MSGGVAYVLDEDNTFATRCNYEMVELLELKDEVQIAELKAMIQKHADYTNSSVALKILSQWHNMLSKFKVVMPKDYHRMLLSIQKVTAQGITGDAALMAAFEENKTDLARVGGS
jgi:glutamate synthase (ferredoxin)